KAFSQAFRQACGFHTAPRTRVTKSARATRCQSCKKAGQLLAHASLMAASGGLAARGSRVKLRQAFLAPGTPSGVEFLSPARGPVFAEQSRFMSTRLSNRHDDPSGQ